MQDDQPRASSHESALLAEALVGVSEKTQGAGRHLGPDQRALAKTRHELAQSAHARLRRHALRNDSLRAVTSVQDELPRPSSHEVTPTVHICTAREGSRCHRSAGRHHRGTRPVHARLDVA